MLSRIANSVPLAVLKIIIMAHSVIINDDDYPEKVEQIVSL